MVPLRRLLILSLTPLPVLALSNPTLSLGADSDTRTVFQDLSNLQVFNPTWNGEFKTDAGDADFYVNSVVITPGAGYDPNLSVFVPPSGLNYIDENTFTQSTYVLGTPISGGQDWDFANLAQLDAFASTAAAIGLYDFSVDFIGGADANDTSSVVSLPLHVDVWDRLDLDVTGTANDILSPSDVSHVSMSVKNNMTRDYVSTTWFYNGFGFSVNPSDPNTPHLDGTFTGNWFNQTIAPGDTLMGAHSDWRYGASAVPGTYIGTMGVWGGLHLGDSYLVSISNGPVIQAVPEPGTMAALGLGILALMRRRKA